MKLRELASLPFRLASSDKSPTYVAAVLIRTGARAAWGLTLPIVLSLTAYGQYNVYATMIAMAVQLAVLGSPQTIIRNAGRDMPMLGLLVHASGLAVFGLLAYMAATGQDQGYTEVLFAAILCTVAYTLFAARAKAFLAFGSSLKGELLGACALLFGLVVLLRRSQACGDICTSPKHAILIEAAAALAALVTFVLVKRARLSRPELTLRGTTVLLRSVYSVGFLVLLDLVIWRRVEVYFLEHSPSGLTGVAVFGLAIQLANMLLLVPTSLVETWQPQFAMYYRDSRSVFVRYYTNRRYTYLVCSALIIVGGLLAAGVAIPFAFPKYTAWLWYVLAFVAIRLICSVAGFHSAVLYAISEERRLYAPVLTGSAIAVLSNVLLTLRYGLAGALVAYLLTQISIAILTVVAGHSVWKSIVNAAPPTPQQDVVIAAG
jgi:O-antigen/teichoic acid export membrane protein